LLGVGHTVIETLTEYNTVFNTPLNSVQKTLTEFRNNICRAPNFQLCRKVD